MSELEEAAARVLSRAEERARAVEAVRVLKSIQTQTIMTRALALEMARAARARDVLPSSSADSDVFDLALELDDVAVVADNHVKALGHAIARIEEALR